MFAVAALFTTASTFTVGYMKSPIPVVALLSVAHVCGNIAGITVPLIVGIIVQITGSYFLAMMFFAVAGIALLICSTAIDYSRRLPV
jgi:ACS family D-galactonate transporter-like MFS transporter